MAETRRTLGGARTARDRVTIYEVAERAGVSIATVSHALNRPEKVKSATRIRVLEAVDELGFTPKATAVSHARKGVGRIGVLGGFSGYPSYLQRLVGVMEACRERNVDVLVFDGGLGAEQLERLLATLPATGRVDGLLIMGSHIPDDVADRLLQRSVHAVLVDGTHRRFSSVNVDDELGGYLLARHFLERGYGDQPTVLVAPVPIDSDVDHTGGGQRFFGFQRAYREAGIGTDHLSVLFTDDDFDGGLAAAQELLEGTELPRLLIGHHDGVAAGVYAGLRRAGIDVPGQVAVAGYDGSDVAQGLDLTSVRQPFVDTGRIGAQLLLDQLAGATARQQILLTPELVPGATT